MFGGTLKFIIAICFVPLVIASTKAFFEGLWDINFLNANLFLLAGGFFTYPILHIVFFKPIYIYAVGHEIIHVLATWLCGGKVTSFRISQTGGGVTTTKSNLFVRLSPYFVPIHTIFLFLLYRILSQFFDMSNFVNGLVFLAGFTMGFHIFMTAEIMKIRQPDIIKTGYLFSVLLIYVANLFVLVLVVSLIFDDISFISFAKNVFLRSKDIYLSIFSKLFI